MVCFTIFAGSATLVSRSARSSPIPMNGLTGVICQTRCAPDMLSFCIQHEHRGAPVGPHAEIQAATVPLLFQPFALHQFCSLCHGHDHDAIRNTVVNFCSSWDEKNPSLHVLAVTLSHNFSPLLFHSIRAVDNQVQY